MRKIINFLFIFLLVSCHKQEVYSYEDFNNNHIIWTEVFTISSGYIYFYSTSCHSCHSIMKEVLRFAHQTKDFYFCKESEDFTYKDGRIEIEGTNNIDQFYICGIPTLIIMDDYVVDSCYLGQKEIIGYIEQKESIIH